jgi:hypothetical protein
MFVVYRGKRDDALDAPSVWRYSAKNALNSPQVPAVDAFRKLIAEAEKQQASHHNFEFVARLGRVVAQPSPTRFAPKCVMSGLAVIRPELRTKVVLATVGAADSILAIPHSP